LTSIVVANFLLLHKVCGSDLIGFYEQDGQFAASRNNQVASRTLWGSRGGFPSWGPARDLLTHAATSVGTCLTSFGALLAMVHRVTATFFGACIADVSAHLANLAGEIAAACHHSNC
jgi:hypothetical protein